MRFEVRIPKLLQPEPLQLRADLRDRQRIARRLAEEIDEALRFIRLACEEQRELGEFCRDRWRSARNSVNSWAGRE
jgi:hypothetical protein